MTGRRLGGDRVTAFLRSLIDGEPTLHWNAADLPRIHELVYRYRDFPLGFGDAAVIVCAEQNGGKVLTLDRRHFGVVAREGTIQILL